MPPNMEVLRVAANLSCETWDVGLGTLIIEIYDFVPSLGDCNGPVKSRHYGHKHLAVTPAPPGKDLGLVGVFVHVVGDAINNVGVIIAALIIWRTDSPSRYYADPAVGVFIAIMIFLTALPLTKSSGSILLQIAPDGIDLGDVKHDIEIIDGVHSVHELHIWRLNQQKSVATAHIVVDDNIARNFTETAKIIMECLHAYGIHSATLQPEAIPPVAAHIQTASADSHILTVRDTEAHPSACQLTCSSLMLWKDGDLGICKTKTQYV
ncbi:hypothetical protein E4U38_002141 [Claviceps purpurea]|nr:hypothetical protein E4U38_002141 [Claviceps purpurea]